MIRKRLKFLMNYKEENAIYKLGPSFNMTNKPARSNGIERFSSSKGAP